ncbi:acetyltransferase-like isoleucine patch superfamily enzyme [Neorhizobium galegae]|uniref:acyltransferase n=1 Tax=Neorhizobium galegae TaxID=399 RepID=UPI001AE77DD9|nr:DapH/DapD/GlmU-related protein [Neorhizobium galegae]MBP2550530.1 acetyltransferase-like isoleucine patch superfamily enzyme [Neorhizobium galegae]
MIGALIQVALWILPWTIRRRLIMAIFRFEIAPTARIGFSIVLARHLQMGSGARIGHLTVITRLRRVEMADSALLGNLNWIGGMPDGNRRHFHEEVDRFPGLIIGPHAAVTHRHLIDCTDLVTIEAFTTFAGWGSQILTHAIDLDTCRQSCAPVTIGQYCFVGTRVVILKGARLPDRSVLAAGSVLARPGLEPDGIYGGVPAVFVKKTREGAAYFRRESGFVS